MSLQRTYVGYNDHIWKCIDLTWKCPYFRPTNPTFLRMQVGNYLVYQLFSEQWTHRIRQRARGQSLAVQLCKKKKKKCCQHSYFQSPSNIASNGEMAPRSKVAQGIDLHCLLGAEQALQLLDSLFSTLLRATN